MFTLSLKGSVSPYANSRRPFRANTNPASSYPTTL